MMFKIEARAQRTDRGPTMKTDTPRLRTNFQVFLFPPVIPICLQVYTFGVPGVGVCVLTGCFLPGCFAIAIAIGSSLPPGVPGRRLGRPLECKLVLQNSMPNAESYTGAQN